MNLVTARSCRVIFVLLTCELVLDTLVVLRGYCKVKVKVGVKVKVKVKVGNW